MAMIRIFRMFRRAKNKKKGLLRAKLEGNQSNVLTPNKSRVNKKNESQTMESQPEDTYESKVQNIEKDIESSP